MFILSLCFSLIVCISTGWSVDEKENFPVNLSDPKAHKSEANGLDNQASFPRDAIEGIYEAFGGEYKKGAWALTTRKTMRQLAVCASQGNPIATLYLAHAFNYTRPALQSICPLAKELYKKAFQTLESVVSQTEDPSATAKERILLAREYNAPAYLNHGPYIPNKVDIALKYLEPLATREATLLKYLINLKHDIGFQPSVEDFLKEEDLKLCPGAFITALDLLDLDYKPEIEALERAIQHYEHPAFLMRLASIYRQYYERTHSEIYKDKCLSLFERAGNLAQPIAYREMAAFFIPYRHIVHSFYFTDAKASDLAKCKECLDKAKDQHLPEAYFSLALYYQEEYKKTQEGRSSEDNERLKQTILDYYKQAAREGFWGVYGILESIIGPDNDFFNEYPNLEKEKEKLFRQAMKAYK